MLYQTIYQYLSFQRKIKELIESWNPNKRAQPTLNGGYAASFDWYENVEIEVTPKMNHNVVEKILQLMCTLQLYVIWSDCAPVPQFWPFDPFYTRPTMYYRCTLRFITLPTIVCLKIKHPYIRPDQFYKGFRPNNNEIKVIRTTTK